MESYILEMDVAHPPMHPDEVEESLLQATLRVRNSSHLHVIKVIHGYGSGGRGGQTKETVRNWAWKNRKKFKAVIHGENYSIFDSSTQLMRTECGQIKDDDLERRNQGVTLFWVT